MAEEDEGRRIQRLKAAVHYTVGLLCEEVAEEREMKFSKQAIAAVSEITFRQCETFTKDLELFARHGKRSTINVEDVKLASRRSRSLHAHISAYSEEVTSSNQERKKKKSAAAGKGQRRSDGDTAVTTTEDQDME
ncbi:centromere protein S [Hyperolius riggenbachi]|uniref:centromere protein S n=1 Tax=Hyperolius riggenbachi TaxID=752182 RepID=UPI0035A2D087